MKTYDNAAAALLDAIEPLSAYLERTARPNRHAEQVEELVNAALDVGEAADARLAGPDWQAIALLMLPLVIPTTAPSALMVRVRAHLDQPHLKARAALPLIERMRLAQLTSHHLGFPDYLREPDR